MHSMNVFRSTRTADFKAKALELYEMHHSDTGVPFTARNGWLDRFKRRQ